MLGRTALLLTVLMTVGVTPSAAQFPPDSLVNLKVLPEDISVRELIGVMRGFALGLGVRCQYCHVGEDGQPLSEFDFPNDEKPTKRRARVMLEMVRNINDDYLARLPERTTPNVAVECATCHRASARPVMIEDVLLQTMDEEGVEAAKTRYRELREEFHGSFTYDFTEFTLSFFAEELLGEQRFDDAIGMLELNGEFFPESSGIPFMLGEANRAKGETELAIQHYERALELNPDLRRAQQRLDQLRGN